MINRVILLLAFFIATTQAGLFDGLFGGGDQDQKQKKVERNQKGKGMPKGRQRTRPVKTENAPVNEQQETKEILKDEAIVDNITPEDDLAVTDASIHEAWAKHMHDFVPDDLINFIVEQGTALVFYESINHVTPTLVKGAYYVHGGDKAPPLEAIMIQDPIKNVIFKRSEEIQGIILFNTTTAGEYTFIFANFKGPTDLAVTMALHTYEATKEEAIEYDFLENNDRVIRGSVTNEG